MLPMRNIMFLFGWFVFWSHLKVGVALELNCEQLFKISRACLQRENMNHLPFLILSTYWNAEWLEFKMPPGPGDGRHMTWSTKCEWLVNSWMSIFGFHLYLREINFSHFFISVFFFFLLIASKPTSDWYEVLQPSSYFQTVSYSLYKSLARFDVQYDFRKHYSFSHLIFWSV